MDKIKIVLPFAEEVAAKVENVLGTHTDLVPIIKNDKIVLNVVAFDGIEYESVLSAKGDSFEQATANLMAAYPNWKDWVKVIK